MTTLLRSLLDRLLLIAAVISGGLAPGFIAQYRQRLGGRLDQAKFDLEPWQRIADQVFKGDLDKLIQYHLASRDPVFHDDGIAIRNIADTLKHLQAAVDALHTGLFRQVGYLALHLDRGLARATWGDWVPTFATSVEGVALALLFALALWLAFQSLWSLVAKSHAGLQRRLLRRHVPPVTGAPKAIRR